MKINLFSISRLRKLELPQFANEVMGIAEKYDPESLKFKETFETLEGLKPQLLDLEVAYGPHPLTVKLEELHALRLKYADLITSQLYVYINADKVAMRTNVELINPIVMRTLDKLNKDSYWRVNEKLLQLFYQIDSDEQLETAFSALMLTEYLNDLRSADASFKELWTKRNVSITGRPKVKVPPIVKETNAALHNLFKQINLLQARNPLLDYTSLIYELNGVIASFRSMIKTRATNNKKKADAKKETQKGVETNSVIESTSETPIAPARFTESTNGMTPKNVELENEGAKNGSFESLNEQKTAAVSTKRTNADNISSKG